ncbi:hypothetical protein [Streptomyces sp. NPDC054787]
MAGGEVERTRHIRAPVQNERGAVGVVRADSDPADVVVTAVGELQTAETQAVLTAIQSGEQAGLLGDQHIALQTGLKTGADVPQGGFDSVFGLVAQVIEAPIEVGDELLLFPEFLG